VSKEPNETLVMTTCTCRENASNLVMTRAYFNEMLENKIAWGAKQEQKRIIELLEEARDKCACYREVGMPICRHQLSVDEQIALIKGGNK